MEKKTMIITQELGRDLREQLRNYGEVLWSRYEKTGDAEYNTIFHLVHNLKDALQKAEDEANAQ